MDSGCKHKQKNESHYHCKFCDYVRRGRQSLRMEKHLISKHAHAIGLCASPDSKSGEGLDNGKYSVIDHSYIHDDERGVSLAAPAGPPTMLMLPHFSEKGNTVQSPPQRNSTTAKENQDNNLQSIVVSTAIPSSTALNTGSVSSCGNSSLGTITLGSELVDRVLLDDQLIESLARSITSTQRQCTDRKRADSKTCAVSNCKNGNSNLKPLLRTKREGGKCMTDWESTKLLLTFHKINDANITEKSSICLAHLKEWCDFNQKLKKIIPRI